jgi:N-acetyl sugar amidotransferase
MDTSDRSITFDTAGHCNHCRGYLARRALLELNLVEGKFEAACDHIRRLGADAPYDCVVGVSGGADSTYVTYRAVEAGLRVLAVHVDNGWDTPLAVRNVKNLVERLAIDYQSAVLDWDEFRDLQLAFFKASVPEIETPTDIAIPAALHRMAAHHGVRTIVSGGNPWTEGILPAPWHYDAKDLTYLHAVHRRFGTGRLRTFPTFGYREEAYYKLVRRIRFAYLLENVRYRTDEVAAILRERLAWSRPSGKHHESVITRFVQSYVLPTKFGIDYRRATFSNRICAGELAREEALHELEHAPYRDVQLADDMRYVAKKLGLTQEAFAEILAAPPKSHRDYPNDERFLQALYWVYRRTLSQRPPDLTAAR